MRIFYPLLLVPFLSTIANAQTPTWSTDVAPIIYNKCASCHHTGGIAPFNLMSYADATSRASTIKAAVQAGSMPPWPPDPAYSRLAHERLLSAAEKAKIVDWVNGTRPRGDVNLEPPAPTFSTGGDLPGTPDLIVKIPTYTSPAATSDMYRCFTLPTGLTADKFITAFEAMPGNRSIVHHVLIFADTTGVCAHLDSLDAGPGYTSFGGVGTNDATMIGGWVPGAVPMKYPAGFGTRLSSRARIVVQIHYPAGSAGQKDSTEIHFFFSPTNNVRNVYTMPVLNHGVNITTPLSIPANTVKTFTEEQMIPYDVSMIGVAPHMHLLGQNIKSWGVGPAGDTLKFINIPKWDFHWQGFYLVRKLLKVSNGTTVYAQATYDNTVNNPMNPSSPPKLVQAGESTTDEMMLVYFIFAQYQAGDENIVIDNTTPVGVDPLMPYYRGVQLLQPYPVPANDQIIAKYHLDKSATGSLELVNMTGQVAMQVFSTKTIAAGYTALPINVSTLPAGIYTLRLLADGQVKSVSVTIQH